jgi:DNA-binding LacI/PurR family transcriptional regulator
MTSRLAFVAPNLRGPFAAGIRDRLAKLHHHALMLRLATDDPKRQREVLRALVKNGSQIPTAIVCVSMSPDADVIAAYRALNVPFVTIDDEANGAGSVSCDNFKGGYLAGRHLIERGHHKIAMISGRTSGPGSYNACQRRDGFRKALAESHVALLTIDCHEVTDYSQLEGAQWFSARPPDTTAVFCAAGDLCASGITKAAEGLKIDIPRELAIVSFDDAPIAQQTRPDLTTIRQPLKDMAEVAFRMACVEPTLTLSKPKHVLLAPELVVRGTT